MKIYLELLERLFQRLRDADFTENVRRVLASVRVKYPDATSNFDPDPKKFVLQFTKVMINLLK